MAMVYSAWSYAGGNGMQVAVDYSVSTVTNGSASVTFTYDVYTINQYLYNDMQFLTYSGNVTGVTNYNNTDGGGVLRYRSTMQYTYNYPPGSFNTSPGSTSFMVTVGGAYNGSSPSLTVTLTIPPRPGSPVSAPTGVTLARVDDTTWGLTWTPQSTPLAPYTSQDVYLQAYVKSGGSWVWDPGPDSGHYLKRSTVGPAVASYSQTNAGPNIVYRAAVGANGQFSTSPLAISNFIYMTPAAPSGLSVSRSPGGSTVTLAWTRNHYPSVGAKYRIEYRVGGGAWVVEQAAMADASSSYIATLPGPGVVEYRIKIDAPDGSVASTWVSFPTVGNAFPPLAPTGLSPTGIARDGALPIVLTWTHNHAGDGAAQSAYEVRWSSDGGASWTSSGAVTSAVSSHTVLPGTFTNGTTYQWQARTVGVTSAGVGAWSASATVIASATPTVTITAPGATQLAVPLTASWTYSQAQASPQAAWEARLLAALGSDPMSPNVVVEERSGFGPADSSTTFAYPIEDGAHYRVEIRVRSSAGLWSGWATQTTLVDLPLPAEPVVTGSYDLCTGTVVLDLDALAPGVGEVAITHAVLERRVGSGAWVTVAAGLPVPTTFVDTLPSTTGPNEYRVTVWSAAPSWRTVTVTVNGLDGPTPWGAGNGLWVFVSWGPGFDRVLRFRGDPEISTGTGRTRRAQHFAGRSRPVLLMGDNTSYELSVAGALRYADPCDPAGDVPCTYDSPPRDWEDMGLSAAVVAYRDFHGRRLFGMLSNVTVDHGLIGHAKVSFTLTQVDVTDPWAAAGESVWLTSGPIVTPGV